MATLLDFIDDKQATSNAAPSGMVWTGTKLPKEVLQNYEAQAAQGKPEIAAMLKSYYQAYPSSSQETKSGTLLDFLDAPASPNLSAVGAVTPQGHLTPQQMEAQVKPAQPGLVTQAFQRALQLRQRAPGEIASALDFVGNLPSQLANTGGYWTGRAFGLNDQEATAAAAPVSQALANPVGRLMGVTDQPGYQTSLPAMAAQTMGNVVQKGSQEIGQRTGISPTDIEQGVSAAMMLAPFAKAPLGRAGTAIKAALPEYTFEPQGGTSGSVGAAAVPTETTIKAALSTASPELQKALSNISPSKVNLPVLQRHIEADSLPVPVRLTEGQATGDVNLLSSEQNRRGADPQLANRFNEQNGQLVKNIDAIRETAAPDAYGTKTIENSDALIDAYKKIDDARNQDINAKYQALRDANGGQFPIDAPTLLENIKKKLGSELLTDEAPSGQMAALNRMADANSMTFENYLSLRRNLSNISATAADGPTRMAAKFMVQELENLPLQEGAKELKPLADTARAAAKARFDMLDKDPAYNAAVNDAVAPDNFVQKFVINGSRDNVQAMIDQLGRDSVAHQHMSGGTLNWLRDKSVDGSGNFSQAAFNKAIKQLDSNQKLNLVFNPDASSMLKTLGNVAHYTQAQPKGSFVNNSNTLVGALADKAAGGLEAGANILGGGKFGVPVGTIVRGQVQKYKAGKATQKALEPAAGVTSLKDIGK
jgi:hypothetical protein